MIVPPPPVQRSSFDYTHSANRVIRFWSAADGNVEGVLGESSIEVTFDVSERLVVARNVSLL
jgi:hypothetical protein